MLKALFLPYKYTYLELQGSFAQLKKSATHPKISELVASNIFILLLLKLAVIKSTTTFPFFKWHKGKKDPIATAQAISTNSKSPNKGLENTTRPKIEEILINAADKRIKTSKYCKSSSNII